MAKEGVARIKYMQSNKMNIIQHIAEAFYNKYLDVTPFVVINIFISNCNLTTIFFSVTMLHVTNYATILLLKYDKHDMTICKGHSTYGSLLIH